MKYFDVLDKIIFFALYRSYLRQILTIYLYNIKGFISPNLIFNMSELTPDEVRIDD